MMKVPTYKERRENEVRAKAKRRRMRRAMKKAGLNPDSQNDQFHWLLKQVYATPFLIEAGGDAEWMPRRDREIL